MKTRIVFETAAEMLDAFARVDGDGPKIPSGVYLVVDGDSRDATLSLSGERSEVFEIEPIHMDELFSEMASRLGIKKVHFT